MSTFLSSFPVRGARGALGGLLLLGAASCGPAIQESYMSKDGSGSQRATTFESVGDEIHCYMRLVRGNEDTVVTLRLDGQDGVAMSDSEFYPWPNSSVQGEVELAVQLHQMTEDGERLLAGPWPTGKFEMSISIDGELDRTLPFTVR